jgi:hypothetical protein
MPKRSGYERKNNAQHPNRQSPKSNHVNDGEAANVNPEKNQRSKQDRHQPGQIQDPLALYFFAYFDTQ